MPQYKHIAKFDPLDKPRPVKTVEELAAVVQRLIQKVNDDSAKLNRELLNLERTSVGSENVIVFNSELTAISGGGGGGTSQTIYIRRKSQAVSSGSQAIAWDTAMPTTSYFIKCNFTGANGPVDLWPTAQTAANFTVDVPESGTIDAIGVYVA